MKKLAISKGCYISDAQIAAMIIPNSTASLTCYGWLHEFFKLVGDFQPNKNDEIHLEPVELQEIHQEYSLDMKHNNCEALKFDAFINIWHGCFPNVKIREFKAVCGKCSTCSNLSDCRRTFKDSKRREFMTMLHKLHRGTYMGERLAYSVILFLSVSTFLL